METKKMIGWGATVSELRQIDALKTALKRNTTADLMRYLVMQEAERILPRFPEHRKKFSEKNQNRA